MLHINLHIPGDCVQAHCRVRIGIKCVHAVRVCCGLSAVRWPNVCKDGDGGRDSLSGRVDDCSSTTTVNILSEILFSIKDD